MPNSTLLPYGSQVYNSQWSLDDLAFRMCGVDPKEWAITRLAIEMFMEVREEGVMLGEMAGQLSKAFGVSEEFFTNMHEAWRKAQRTTPENDKATEDKTQPEANA